MAQYDDVANRYAALIEPKYQPIAQLVVDRLPDDVEGTVVEPGVGTGLLTQRALPRLPECREYIGIDISAGMLEVARTRLPSWVRLIESSALAMPMGDSLANLLISSLGPVQESNEFFAEALRVMAPGAPLLLTCWGEGYRELDLLQAARTRLGAGSYPTGVAERVRQRADKAGLVDLSVEDVRIPVSHASLDEYVAYRHAFGRMPWIPEGADDEWDALLREEASRYVTESGEVALDWTILVVSGRRNAS
jgi:SAM-dependent methyltransferase